MAVSSHTFSLGIPEHVQKLMFRASVDVNQPLFSVLDCHLSQQLAVSFVSHVGSLTGGIQVIFLFQLHSWDV
jgi:hypothetical protein